MKHFNVISLINYVLNKFKSIFFIIFIFNSKLLSMTMQNLCFIFEWHMLVCGSLKNEIFKRMDFQLIDFWNFFRCMQYVNIIIHYAVSCFKYIVLYKNNLFSWDL